MARGEDPKLGTQVREAQRKSGQKVWWGSRGARCEATVVRYLGWGSYSVFIDEEEVSSVDEGLLSSRQDDEGAEGQELRGPLVETNWQASASERRSLVESRRIRW